MKTTWYQNMEAITMMMTMVEEEEKQEVDLEEEICEWKWTFALDDWNDDNQSFLFRSRSKYDDRERGYGSRDREREYSTGLVNLELAYMRFL